MRTSRSAAASAAAVRSSASQRVSSRSSARVGVRPQQGGRGGARQPTRLGGDPGDQGQAALQRQVDASSLDADRRVGMQLQMDDRSLGGNGGGVHRLPLRGRLRDRGASERIVPSQPAPVVEDR
jgi:hypothetical protein